MSSKNENIITAIDKPRCSRCGAFKNISELGGYDPLAPVGHKSKHAYCIKLVECNSDDAKQQLDDLIKELN